MHARPGLRGMQIFIPDGQSASSVGKGYDLATAEERDVARERATLQVGSPAQQRNLQQEEEQLPEWWNPSPALHVSLYYKEEVRFNSSPRTPSPNAIPVQGTSFRYPFMLTKKSLEHHGAGRHLSMRIISGGRVQRSRCTSLQAEKNAKSIVRELEDTKLAGIDYPVSSLINLRQVGPLTFTLAQRPIGRACLLLPQRHMPCLLPLHAARAAPCPHHPRTSACLALPPIT